MSRPAAIIAPGLNPDVGFLHCGNRGLTVNISTHTGFGERVNESALRVAVERLAAHVPLLASRLRLRRHLLPGRHHDWVVPAGGSSRIPLEFVELPRGAGLEATEAFCAAGANIPIDPSREPPFRVALLRGEGRCDLVITSHHALYDGASCGFLFYALKRLYVETLAGKETTAPLPPVAHPGEAELLRRQVPELSRRLSLRLRGWRELMREGKLASTLTPDRSEREVRSLHHTLFIDLDRASLAGLKMLIERGATLNEIFQAVLVRVFFPWCRQRGWIRHRLPLATTFNLRRPGSSEYLAGNYETALAAAVTEEEVAAPERLLEILSARSRRWKSSPLPLAHFSALGQLASLPSPWIPSIVGKVARCGVLLFSYLGSDFSRRYLGHYGGADDADLVRLVRDCPGSGAGYVTSAPPMGLVVTLKRVRKTMAVNLSLHSLMTDEAGLRALAAAVDEQADRLAATGRRV